MPPVLAPPFVKNLIKLTVIFTLVCIICEGLFAFPFQEFFSLNYHFFTEYFWWQPLTSIFLLPSPVLSFGFLFDIAFQMLILWLLGGQIYDFMGRKRFFVLYFGGALISCVAALAMMYCGYGSTMLSLCPAGLCALMTVWTMCAPAANVLVFFLPLPAKWFLVIAFLGTAVSSAIQGDMVRSVAYTSAYLFAYLVAVMAWSMRGPFEGLFRFEAVLKRFSHTMSSFWQWKVLAFLRRLRR